MTKSNDEKAGSSMEEDLGTMHLDQAGLKEFNELVARHAAKGCRSDVGRLGSDALQVAAGYKGSLIDKARLNFMSRATSPPGPRSIRALRT